jgi:hypothetical protein
MSNSPLGRVEQLGESIGKNLRQLGQPGARDEANIDQIAQVGAVFVPESSRFPVPTKMAP